MTKRSYPARRPNAGAWPRRWEVHLAARPLRPLYLVVSLLVPLTGSAWPGRATAIAECCRLSLRERDC